jgi:predicted nucleotidyltransferase
LDEKILKERLQELLKEENNLKKSLKALAILTELLKERGIKPILVGGRALEFYTLGGYATKDIDLVINGREYAKEALEKMGFGQ